LSRNRKETDKRKRAAEEDEKEEGEYNKGDLGDINGEYGSNINRKLNYLNWFLTLIECSL
jgi:hypothetical protein